MLKLLLGHWKAHRKKPSLLPEDGDIHFEEQPSTINPLFEDSDSSISSKKSVHSKPLEQSHSFSQVENEQNVGENNESLKTQTNPQVENVKNTTQTNKPEQINKDSQIITEESNIETGAATSNDSSENLVPLHTNNSEISNISLPKKEIIDAERNENSETVENSKESKISEKEISSDKVKSEVSNQNFETTPNEKTEKSDIKSDENMRLYNQPSTSAIIENKKLVSEVTNGIDKTHIPASKSTNALKTDKQENKEKTVLVKKGSDVVNDKAISNQNRPFKQATHNSATAKTVQQDNEDEKPAKLKAKAIDELIKKFQGPKTENENETSVSKIVKTDSVNQSSGFGKLKVKDIKAENINTSSPSIQNNKSVQNIIKPERTNLSKTNDPNIQSNSQNKNSSEIEALSNIFKFPPPPPLDQLQKNESSLHGKILKDRKTNPLSSISKINENEAVSKETDSGKTRSDSSLDRTRTASSSNTKSDVKLETSETKETVTKIDKQPFKESSQLKPTESNSTIKEISSNKNKVKIKANESSLHTKTSAIKQYPAPKIDTEREKSNIKETKTTESEAQSSQNDLRKKGSPVSNPKTTQSSQNDSKKNTSSISSPKTSESTSIPHQNDSRKKESPVSIPKTEISSKSVTKNLASTSKNPPKSPVQIHKSSISKASAKLESVIESENAKLNSEDSGITRGDQISSETTQEIPSNDLPEQAKSVPNSIRKNKKDKKAKSINKKVCKNCRHAHSDNIPIKRSPCDDYYDGLTGIHIHKSRHSDSWTSDLSWEERELLRRLRSRRGTVKSNTPSTRSRLSKHRFIDESYFRRPHNFRRSISDESSFYGASLCSCDECWAMYLKEYAYGRASLRGMSPIQEICTCRNSHHNFLGRRVQFRPDIIHEASPSERTVTTPAPSIEKKKQDDDDDKNSQKSSKSKEGDSVSSHPEGHKQKKSKNSEGIYRYVSPWELEELDLVMRKHLLKKRRRRARCMGVMALAMVVFIGLIVAIVMVYLRRKTL